MKWIGAPHLGSNPCEMRPRPGNGYNPGMEQRTLGKTNLSVSVLGFGSAPVGLLKTEQDRVAAMLNMMLDAGVNLLDTAAMYAGAEELIGNTVSDRRSEYVLVSKCGSKLEEFDAPAFSPPLITYTVDRALKRLQTDVLDVMLLHSCDLETLKKGDALDALLRARDAGKIRFAGYSGDNEAAAYAAALPDIAVIETSVSIVDQANIDTVLPLCVQHNVGVLAKRPIGNAAWRGIEGQPGFYKQYAKPYVERFQKMGLTLEKLGLSGDPNAVWPEIALRFTLAQSGVSCAIIGTTNPDNARRNIAAAEKGPLPPTVSGQIREAFAAADPKHAWKGET
jgi:aryl-alcohol dehydrogenase-like predicted oxidoreductase